MGVVILEVRGPGGRRISCSVEGTREAEALRHDRATPWRRAIVNKTKKGTTHMKEEGVLFTPLPVERDIPETPKVKLRLSREASEPLCEMCGHRVIAAHCKRICLHCGFMTGCSEGI